jgi:hypothetical protein
MNRASGKLQPPEPGRDYAGFPAYHHRARMRRYRAHGMHRPWYFSSSVGSFNLEATKGTLNCASTEPSRRARIPRPGSCGGPCHSCVNDCYRWISHLEIPGIKAAVFTAGAAASFGIVPGDVTAPMGDSYVPTRAWAAAMAAAGSRFGAGANPTCLYIFGPAGEREIGSVNAKVTMRSVTETMHRYAIDSIPTCDVLVVDPWQRPRRIS